MRWGAHRRARRAVPPRWRARRLHFGTASSERDPSTPATRQASLEMKPDTGETTREERLVLQDLLSCGLAMFAGLD